MTADRPARGAWWAAVLVPLAVLHAGVLAGGVYFQNDVQLMWLQGTQAVAQALVDGAWPFWNVRSAFGEPLLANANHQVLYPPSWPGLLLPPAFAYTLLVLVHHAWLAAGLHRLARELGLSPLAAMLAAALGTATGPVVSVATVWNQLCGFAWVPWAGVFAVRAARDGDGRAVAGAAVCTGAALLAGSPEAAATCALVVGVAALASGARGAWRRGVATAAAAIALGVLLSAPQWAPTLMAARDSARSRLPAETRLASSIDPRVVAGVAVPLRLHAQPFAPETRVALFGAWDPLVASPYLGGATLVLAALGVGRRRAAVLLAAGIATALLIAVGGHGPFGALVHLPLVGLLRYPSKALIVAGLGLPLLAGLGWDRAAGLPRAQVAARTAGALAVASLALLAAATTLGLAPGALVGVALPGLVAALAAAGALLVGTPRARGAAALLAVVDLVLAHFGLHATAPPALFQARPSFAARVLESPEPRLHVVDYFFFGAAARHLGTTRGYDLARAPGGWSLPASQALGLRLACYPPTAASWGASGSFDADVAGLGSRAVDELRDLRRAVEGTPRELDLLRLASVTHVVAMHEAPGLAPLAVEPGLFRQDVRLYAVPGPLRRARLEHVDALERPELPPALPSGSARVERRSADGIEVTTSSPAAAVLVLADAWDAGWVAEVDGRPADVRRVHHAFLAVAVPAGTHRVALRYVPPGLAAGLAAFGLGALGAALAARRRFSG